VLRRPANFQLARIFGIRVGVNISWFFVLFFYIFVLAPYFHNVLGGSQSTATALAITSALAFFGSIVLHELGHALAARREGIPVDGIDLWMLGGFARIQGDPQTPGAELRIALAGPLVTFVIIVAGIVAGDVLWQHRFWDVATGQNDVHANAGLVLVSWLTSINVLVFLFNLVPAFPLDGGRIARAVVWKRTGDRTRGTRATGRLGQGFALLVGLLGLTVMLGGDSYGLWFLFLAFFIWQQANAAVVSSHVTERIASVRVADIMDREPVTIDGDTPLLEVHEEFFLRYRWPWFAVVDHGRHFLGLVREDRVDAEIAAGRPALTAAEVVDPQDLSARVGEDASLEMLLGSEGLRRLGAVFAVDGDGVLQGVVTIAHVQRALQPSRPR
jgi:Zn-dependent protease